MTVALVTASTGGIGRAVAQSLAEEGVDVVVNGRSTERGEALVKELEDQGVDGHFEQANINEYEEVEQMVSNAVEVMGGIDILVTSGGAISGPQPNFFRDTPPEDILAFCRCQFANRIYAIKAVLEYMIENGGGRIVNVGTDAAREPTPGEFGPGSAGAALLMATRTLAAELSRWNITVNTVCISVVEGTSAMDWVIDSPVGSVFEAAIEQQTFPVTENDIGEIVSYLSTADGTQPMTGQILSVNGGVSYPG